VNGRVTQKLFNLFGRQVATLFDVNAEACKSNRIRFNAGGLPQGIYFSRLESGGETLLNRVVLGR
jgi:hypothetical protein